MLAGTWAWIVIAGRTGFASAVGPAAMLLVLLPPLGLQVARHTDPFTRGKPYQSFSSDFRTSAWRNDWEVTGRGNILPNLIADGVVVHNDGLTASALTHIFPRVAPDSWAWWRRPLGTSSPSPSYDVTWRARVNRTKPYFTITSLGRVTVQAVNGGYLITAPSLGGDVKGDYIATDASTTIPSMWALSSTPRSTALSIDGKLVWTGGSSGLSGRLILGDASSDTEHGGTLTLTTASITQRLTLISP